MRRRFQFSLKTVLWLMLCIACFFGGTAWRRQADKAELNATRQQLDEERATSQKWLRAVFVQGEAIGRLQRQVEENASEIADGVP